MPSSLQLNEITKRFPGVRALDRVTFSAEPGSVHALIGENGAGKSTLLKILAGIYQPDSGSLNVDGTERQFVSAASSIAEASQSSSARQARAARVRARAA